MCLRKLWLLAVLVTVVAFLAAKRLEVQGQKRAAFDTKSQLPPSVFLPSKNPKDLAAGKLLVASRELGDPNFAQTVILLVDCDAKGVVGLILNRRTRVPLSRVLEQLKAAKHVSDPVYLGGPVGTPDVFGLLRSTDKPEGARQILDGVYFISSKSVFEKTISGRPDPGMFHAYLGYAGWDYLQLRKEVEVGAWFIFPADARTIFEADPDSLWREMIKKTELKLAEILPGDQEGIGTTHCACGIIE